MNALALILLLFAAPARAAVAPSQSFPGIFIDDRGRAEEHGAIEAALIRLELSALARRKEALRRRAGFEITIAFDALSAADDEGLLGRAYWNSGRARVLLDESLLTAPLGLHQTLAHELYGHTLSRMLAPKFLSAHTYRLEEEEANAAVIGAVAARELGLEEVPDARVDALLESGAAYHAEVLFSDSPARITLSLDEARDPLAAISARLRELARRRKTLEAREGGDRVWRAAFAHFEKVHGMPSAAFASARDSIDGWRKDITVPRRVLLDGAEPHLKSVIPFLEKDEEGLAYSKIMIALARSPYPAALARETEALAKRLTELRAAAAKPTEPAPEAAAEPAGALTWGDIQDLYNRDHAEHPEHWKNEEKTVPPQDWLLK